MGTVLKEGQEINPGGIGKRRTLRAREVHFMYTIWSIACLLHDH
jgi:hypothetical protein